MNICFIPSAELEYESGSTIYATQIAERIADNGVNVHVICSKKPVCTFGKVKYHCIDIMEHPVIDDYDISTSRMIDSIYRIVMELLRIHEQDTLDIVHAHYATINGIAAQLFKIVTNVPYVVSCFGRDVFNGAENDVRYLNMVKNCLIKADYIVCSNNTVQNRIYELSGTVSNIGVLQMPVDTKIFSAKSIKENTNTFNLINIASNFSPEKGLEVTLNAFARIVTELNINATLTFVGKDEHPKQKNLLYLKKLIDDLEISEYVRFTGQVPHRLIPELIRNADILIDSRLVGNFSSVILEALSMNCMVIASNADGNKEFIVDGENGYLYQKGNSNSLFEKLKSVLTNERKRIELYRGVQGWVEDNMTRYSLDGHIDNLFTIFKKILEVK